mgnify:CR=1 FL=1
MYRIIDSRSSGKTSRLMLLAKETGSVIACMNPSAMRQKAHAYGITGVQFISYSDLFTGEYDENKVMIDDEIKVSGIVVPGFIDQQQLDELCIKIKE